MRITSTEYDDEIEGILDAAIEDLRISGVASSAVDAEVPDALVKRAILLYAKAEFGLDNPDSEKYRASFLSLERALAASAEYAQPAHAGITGSITAGSTELTVDDDALITADDWLTVAGAGVGGGLLLARVLTVADNVVGLDQAADTTVAAGVVTVR